MVNVRLSDTEVEQVVILDIALDAFVPVKRFAGVGQRLVDEWHFT